MKQTLRKTIPTNRKKNNNISRSRSPTLRGSNADGDFEREKERDLERDGADGALDGAVGRENYGQTHQPPRRDSKLDRKEGYDKKDPFEEEEGEGGDGVKYRTLEWWQAAMIMIAETISLGILSLPSVLATLGMVPGAILIVSLGLIATYSGYVIGQFKMAHPWVHSMADAGAVLFAPLGHKWEVVGREVLGAAQVIFLIFSMASHVLTFTICFNTITDHATCTIVWSVVAFILFWIFDLPRTLKKVSWLSIASFISIISAVLTTMIAVGVRDIDHQRFDAVRAPTFQKAFLSVTNIVFAYAGHVAFFSFISEMKQPRDFPKALYLLQFVDVAMYFTVAMQVYAYVGNDVSSPALGSAGTTVSKVAYGLAIPTIIIAGVIYGHVASKYIYVRIFRGTKHMSKRTFLSVGSWAAITLTLWVIAWIIAESIPVFNNLLALISSLFASWFTYGLSGIFWLFLNYGGYTQNARKMILTVVNIGMFLLGLAICGMGLYVSGYAIHNESGTGSWSCANNVNS